MKVNNKVYDFTSASITMLNREVTGVKAISFSENRQMDWLKGSHGESVALGFGPTETEGKITLYQYEAQAIRNAMKSAGVSKIWDIDFFDIIIRFGQKIGNIDTVVLRNCKFTGDGMDLSVDNTSDEREYELKIGNIENINQ